MRLVFWQNCLSPHQLPYIVHLLDDRRVDNVVIVVEEAINDVREKMGWDITSFQGLEKCEVYLAPSVEEIERLLSVRQNDSYHFFSGIRGFRFVFNAFKLSLKHKLKRGLITERPNTFAFGSANGKPLWLHRIRFFVQDRKYAPYIQFVFAMGDDAVKYFTSVWKHWNVYPFAYCTQNASLLPSVPLSKEIRFVYVGSLSWWKSVLDILRAKKIVDSFHHKNKYQVNYIGEGNERHKLENYTQKYALRDVFLLGMRKNSEIPNLLVKQDVLILPSVYDGWGAVVNEALSEGLYVICSDKCGARELLKNQKCGCVFKSGNYKQLANAMQNCIIHIDEIRNNREYRQEWARHSISGEVVAKYMIDCLMGMVVKRPWFR